jgi:hypothetical protein
MAPRDDFDGQATSGRAVRRKNVRTRQAARLVVRAGWLEGHLVFWTGQREEVPRLADEPAPLRAVLQDRFAELPAGLYAVQLSFPNACDPGAGAEHTAAAQAAASPTGTLAVEITGVEEVTRERIAATARAVEAVSRFPTAAARLVGPVDRWRHRALSRLDCCRQAVDGTEASRLDSARAARALGLEAGALWLGSVPPPSDTLPDAALAALTETAAGTSADVAQLAAVALGRRHKAAACHARLAAWSAAGSALDRWPAGGAAWAAMAIGPGKLAALAAATPGLNDTLAAFWLDERRLDLAAATAAEISGLATLLAALASVRTEPDRRDSVLRRLAVQYLRLAWAPSPDHLAPRPQDLTEAFRDVVLDEVYGTVRNAAAPRREQLPGNPFELAECWVGQELVERLHAYVDHILTLAAHALGNRSYWSMYSDPPTSLSASAPPASAVDPAGPAVYVALTNRLRWAGVPEACQMMAAWLETCRPTIRLDHFWRYALAIVPSGGTRLDADRGRNLAGSLASHERRIATELALSQSEQAPAVRALLPAVLARGADASDRVFRRDLWMPGEEALDAALRWVEAVERHPRASDPNAALPVPRRVFTVAEPAVREALYAIGFRSWGECGVSARRVELLLGTLVSAASRSDASYWRIALPALVDVAVGLARRLLGPPERPEDAGFERADLVCAILDVCARWQDEGSPDAGRLARSLADRWTIAEKAEAEWTSEDEERNALIVRLSEGRVPRFLDLLRHRSPARQFEWRAIDGWALVVAHPDAHAWISACLDRPKLVARVIQLLERLALVARLDPGLTSKRMFKPLDRPVSEKAARPPWVAPDAAAMLDEVERASGVAGLSGAMPGALQRLLDRGATAERELTVLRERAESIGLSPAERARVEKLEQLSGDPEQRSAELSAELRRALPKHVALAGLTALEALARRDLECRWQKVLGGARLPLDDPAWDNALHMLWSVKYNRRVLVRLLKHAARGDRVWTRDLTPNRTFLAGLAAAGLRPDEWLADWSMIVASPAGRLTVYTATDPLEILQMGSLFGTCLSAGKLNAHAAVAAAVEANKRVLYVKDAAGRVVGRQLLALTAAGELMGFTAYGAGSAEPEGHGVWVKLALELLALAIARATCARLMPAERASEGLSDAEEESLTLFCRGYVDSLEQFDWWVLALAEADPRSDENDGVQLRALLERPVPVELDAREGPQWRRDELGWSACRALLWLGPDAPSLPLAQEEALGLVDAQRAVIGRANHGA